MYFPFFSFAYCINWSLRLSEALRFHVQVWRVGAMCLMPSGHNQAGNDKGSDEDSVLFAVGTAAVLFIRARLVTPAASARGPPVRDEYALRSDTMTMQTVGPHVKVHDQKSLSSREPWQTAS